MYPILFSIGKINFYTYGLFAAISVIAVYFIMDKLAKISKLDNHNLLDKTMIVFLAGLIGARVSYFFIYHDQFDHWLEIFYLWNGGLTSFGGIFAGLLAFAVVFRNQLAKWLDILAVSFLLGSSIWRIGGYLSGGNPGILSDSSIAIGGRIPIVLIESIILFIAFLFIYRFYTHTFKSVGVYKHKNIKAGIIFWVIFGFYGIIRIAMDYFRDYSYSIGILRLGQVIGLIMFIVSIVAILYMILYDKTEDSSAFGKKRNVRH